MYDGLHKIGAHDTYLFDDWGYALELFPWRRRKLRDSV